jgi:cytochrome b561
MGKWADGPASYGWISIALHWLSVAAILGLLFIGGSIEGERTAALLHLHTTIAVIAYPLLTARIAYRLAKGHPRRLPRQGPIAYAVGRWVHYGLILALTAMLVSGPVAAWSGGLALDAGPWRLTAPSAPQPQLHAIAHAVHYVAANCLGWGTLLHVLAVTKHVAIDGDGALERILAPAADKPSEVDPGA